MARWGRSAVHYRNRRVEIRLGENDAAKLEKMLQQDLKDIMVEHYEELSEVAEQIDADASYLAPFETGELESSIMVRTYKGFQPGLIAHASAHDQGFDYAIPQEYNEEYDHDYTVAGEEREKESASAHYLGGSFALRLSEWYNDVTGKTLILPAELEHAMNYVSDKI